jgi:hypothetical protein
MTEPLTVDPARLKEAGATLQALVFPTPPPPIFAAGTDPVSAAINETLPIIESPVIDGLPAVKTAVTRTGSSIVSAAGLYEQTDQALSEHVDGVQFLAAAQTPANGPSARRLLGAAAAEPKGNETQGKPEPKPEPDKTVAPSTDATNPLGQVNGLAQALGPVSQPLQTIMSGVQQATGSMGSAGSSSAQLADDTTKTEHSPGDETQLVDKTSKADDAEPLTEGAAPGDQATGSVPLTPTAGRPEVAQSEVRL